MSPRKLLVSCIVFLIVACSLIGVNLAAGFTYENEAKKLYEAGLLKGRSSSEYQPDLSAYLTRQEGIIMMVRLAGEESKALEMSDYEAKSQLEKFVDAQNVDAWAMKYVAYMCQKNYVIGTSNNTLSPKQNLIGNDLCTMILRIAGMDIDAEKYEKSCNILSEIGGLSEKEKYRFNRKKLIRDDAVGICYGSLKIKLKDGTILAEKLYNIGVIQKNMLEIFKSGSNKNGGITTEDDSNKNNENNDKNTEYQNKKLTNEQLEAIKKLLEKTNGEYKNAHVVENCVLDPSSNDPSIVALSKENHNKLVGDGQNALMTAALFSHTGETEYAEYCTNILKSWAERNKSFTGKNGFLASAWGVGAMARAARILKESFPEKWLSIKNIVEPWLINTAESYWMPKNPNEPTRGTKPQLIQKWEMEHISNRTFTALEATMHVAYLIEDDDWFSECINKYKDIVPKFVVNYEGENADDYRGDVWHKTAGIASMVQICELAKNKGYDLYPLYDEAVKRTAEYYARQANTQIIPFWKAIYKHYGEDKVPNCANLVKRDKGSFYNWYIHGIEFLWGLEQFL